MNIGRVFLCCRNPYVWAAGVGVAGVSLLFLSNKGRTVGSYLRCKLRNALLRLAGGYGTLTQMGNVYSVQYTDGVNVFRVVFKKSRSPSSIVTATCGAVDVTADLLEYLGVSKNFHGISTTPAMLGMSEVEITRTDRPTTVYKDNDIITI